MRKSVLFVVLTFSVLLTSCNKKVEESTQEQIPNEETTQVVVDSTVTDTVATMVEPKDSISK